MSNGELSFVVVCDILSICHRMFQLIPTSSIGSRRTMMLQEHHGMTLLTNNGIAVPPYGLAHTPDEAYQQAKHIGLYILKYFFKMNEFFVCCVEGQDYVIKAQVLAGGRGKGKFTSGLEGGVQICFSPEEAREKAKMMIGSHLVTKQTTSEGRLCQEVLVCKRLFTRREYYFSIMLDRAHTV